jgi:hypothetical protein
MLMPCRTAALALLVACLLAPPPLPAQQWLEAPHETNAAVGDNNRAMADFDGDGRLDLLVVRSSASIAGAQAMWIAFATASGEFVPGPNLPLVAGGYQGDAYTLAGDVTGDGLPDIVMSWNAIGGFAQSGFVMYRNLGAGTFATAVPTVVGGIGLAGSGVLGDWNGDGTKELVAANYQPLVGNYAVRRWSWQGTAFQASNVLTFVDFLSYVAVGDIDADGLQDCVVGSGTALQIYVMRTLPGGNLGTAQPIVVAAGGSVAGCVPNCGDIDGDGDDDIVVGWPQFQGGSHLVVITNGGAAGLTTGPDQLLQAEPGTYWNGRAHVTDWDGDGDGDVLIGHELLWPLENLGGTLHVRGSIRIARHLQGPVIEGNEGVGVADFDGDQRPDFVGARALVFASGRFTDDAFPTTISSFVQAVDDDGDGDLDLVESAGVRHENRGSGVFVPQTGRFPSVAPPFRYVEAFALGDFTGDGLLDQVVTYFQQVGIIQFTFVGMRLLRGTTSGSFVDAGPAGPAATTIGDAASFLVRQRVLDGDGDVDIATTDGYWDNNGAGTFATFHPAWTGTPTALEDVNGDGRIDVLTRRLAGNTIDYRIFLAQPGGGYVGQLLATDTANGQSAKCVLADLDDDGDLDFAVGLSTGPTIALRANQNGAFAPAVLLATRGSAFETLLVADFDGDGLTDLAAASSSEYGQPALVWRRVGPGLVHANPRSYLTPEPLGGSADLDGDGDVDWFGRDARTLNGRWARPDNGGFTQYGSSVPSNSGAAPILGVRGPVRSVSTLELRLRRTPPNSLAALDFGLASADVPDVPFPGLTLRVVPILLLVLATPGNAGVPGSGAADMLIATPPGMLGQRCYLQAFTLDTTSFGGSNGLEFVFGL